MNILASDFSGLVPFLCFGLVAVVLALGSFYVAWRGHWAALPLVAPLFVMGLLWSFQLWGNASDLPLGACLIILSPLVVALTSVGLWFARMRVRRRRAGAIGFNPVLSTKQGW
ncbi:MAG: hypothetical protein WBD40_06080 [Tepidisphaeraceae bacterium]